MRHALVPVHLLHQARAATPPRAATDAPPDEPGRARRRIRRRARLTLAVRRWGPFREGSPATEPGRVAVHSPLPPAPPA